MAITLPNILGHASKRSVPGGRANDGTRCAIRGAQLSLHFHSLKGRFWTRNVGSCRFQCTWMNRHRRRYVFFSIYGHSPSWTTRVRRCQLDRDSCCEIPLSTNKRQGRAFEEVSAARASLGKGPGCCRRPYFNSKPLAGIRGCPVMERPWRAGVRSDRRPWVTERLSSTPPTAPRGPSAPRPTSAGRGPRVAKTTGSRRGPRRAFPAFPLPRRAGSRGAERRSRGERPGR